MRKLIRDHSHRLKKKPPKRMHPVTRGKQYDLRELFDRINDEYFDGRVSAEITWGGRAARRAVKRRTLGSYSAANGTIRINPLLDSRRIPEYFLELVIYHEMLHADMGIAPGNGRRSVHSPEFRKREKLFIHYEKAIHWEKNRW